MLAPGKVYALIVKPGKKLLKAKKKATFKIAETIPKVKILIGKKTMENMGFIINDTNHNPAMTTRRFLGLEPVLSAGIKFVVV